MRKKICFVTTVGLTIKSFLVNFANYLVDHRNYEVTFICADDEKLAQMQSEYIHFVPVEMSRGVNLDAVKVIGKMKRIFEEQQFDIVLQSQLIPLIVIVHHSCYLSALFQP